ncbi:conserved membrane hypothetical protein [metagenome]|uniref:DUF4064 domain-containing protein n=1 Tax=metagenome TaxID=256318 RepID=A0A2P2BZU7_9ZZZZ
MRPSQVTMAGWMVIVGSVVVVLTAFEQIGSFHTLEVREEVERFLRTSTGEGLGLSTESALTLLRLLAMVAAGCATAAAVLGWHVLRRHRPSRIALSIVAVPLFLSGIVAGGFFSSLVAASALLLWSRPARDWFDGVSRPRPEVVHPSGAREPGHWSSAPPPVEAAPYVGFGTLPPPPPHAVAKRDRPDQVLWACVVSWAFSALCAVGLGIGLLALLVEGHALIDDAIAQNPDLDTSGMSQEALLVGVSVVIAVLFVWSLLVMGATYFVWLGRSWARKALLASSAVVAAVSLLALFSNLVTLPVLIASAVVLRLLLTSRAAAWCAPPPPPR